MPDNSVLIPMDVTSLYTNILHEDGGQVAQKIRDQRPGHEPPTIFLLHLLDIILNKNYFHFDGSSYFQCKGVAMGCPIAPSIVNLYMSNWGNKYIFN